MIPCNERCQLYYRCECKDLNHQCVFDMGFYEKDDNKDEFLERTTY